MLSFKFTNNMMTLFYLFFPGVGEVRFTLKGAILSNNSLVTSDDIGEGEDALRCMTDNTSCCRPPYTQNLGQSALGNWFFPNGTRVPSSDKQSDFHRTRGDMAVLLHRRRGGEDGVYYCVVPDKEGNDQTTYIGVYTAGTGEWYMHTNLQYVSTLSIHLQLLHTESHYSETHLVDTPQL